MVEQEIHSEELKGRLSRTSKDFRTVFLMAFTKELIKNTSVEEFFELEKIIKGDRKIKRKEETLASLERKYGEMIPSIVNRERENFRKFPKLGGFQNKINAPQNEKPVSPKSNVLPPSQELQLNLGRLNSLIQDMNVLSIECNGSEENLIVRGSFGTRQTNIALSKDEIINILNNFSEATKNPLHEGIFKVAYGGLTISAIVSDVVGSKFIVRKVVNAQF